MEKKKKGKLNLKIRLGDINPGALFIIKKLNEGGYEALVVGGCIRNLVMGEEAHDWDITTSATSKEISRTFKGYKVIPVGEKYGTIMVVIKAVNYQVTTFRGKDKLKGREETEVAKWTSVLREDLKHRDFTINTLVWAEKEGVLDYFKGLEDIKRRVIKGVEDPSERIKEDPLRMLRAIRIACKLDFKIDQATFRAIKENSLLIKKVSIERIRDELIKILLSNYPKRGFKLLYQLGLLRFIMPELHKCAGIYRENFQGGENLLEYILDLLENLPSNFILRLSIISYIIKSISKSEDKKEITTKILRQTRFKNTVIKKINLLIQEDWESIDFSKKGKIRPLASRIGMENLEDIWELKKAFIKESQRTEKFKSDEIKTGENNIRETLQEKPPVSYINLAVKGKDLLELGYKEGDKLGEILKKMLQIVINRPELNEKEILLKIFTANREDVP